MSTYSSAMKRQPKSKVIFVKATPEEHKLFSKFALTRHTNLSELIRQLLHREVEASQKAA